MPIIRKPQYEADEEKLLQDIERKIQRGETLTTEEYGIYQREIAPALEMSFQEQIEKHLIKKEAEILDKELGKRGGGPVSAQRGVNEYRQRVLNRVRNTETIFEGPQDTTRIRDQLKTRERILSDLEPERLEQRGPGREKKPGLAGLVEAAQEAVFGPEPTEEGVAIGLPEEPSKPTKFNWRVSDEDKPSAEQPQAEGTTRRKGLRRTPGPDGTDRPSTIGQQNIFSNIASSISDAANTVKETVMGTAEALSGNLGATGGATGGIEEPKGARPKGPSPLIEEDEPFIGGKKSSAELKAERKNLRPLSGLTNKESQDVRAAAEEAFQQEKMSREEISRTLERRGRMAAEQARAIKGNKIGWFFKKRFMTSEEQQKLSSLEEETRQRELGERMTGATIAPERVTEEYKAIFQETREFLAEKRGQIISGEEVQKILAPGSTKIEKSRQELQQQREEELRSLYESISPEQRERIRTELEVSAQEQTYEERARLKAAKEKTIRKLTVPVWEAPNAPQIVLEEPLPEGTQITFEEKMALYGEAEKRTALEYNIKEAEERERVQAERRAATERHISEILETQERQRQEFRTAQLTQERESVREAFRQGIVSGERLLEVEANISEQLGETPEERTRVISATQEMIAETGPLAQQRREESRAAMRQAIEELEEGLSPEDRAHLQEQNKRIEEIQATPETVRHAEAEARMAEFRTRQYQIEADIKRAERAETLAAGEEALGDVGSFLTQTERQQSRRAMRAAAAAISEESLEGISSLFTETEAPRPIVPEITPQAIAPSEPMRELPEPSREIPIVDERPGPGRDRFRTYTIEPGPAPTPPTPTPAPAPTSAPASRRGGSKAIEKRGVTGVLESEKGMRGPQILQDISAEYGETTEHLMRRLYPETGPADDLKAPRRARADIVTEILGERLAKRVGKFVRKGIDVFTQSETRARIAGSALREFSRIVEGPMPSLDKTPQATRPTVVVGAVGEFASDPILRDVDFTIPRKVQRAFKRLGGVNPPPTERIGGRPATAFERLWGARTIGGRKMTPMEQEAAKRERAAARAQNVEMTERSDREPLLAEDIAETTFSTEEIPVPAAEEGPARAQAESVREAISKPAEVSTGQNIEMREMTGKRQGRARRAFRSLFGGRTTEETTSLIEAEGPSARSAQEALGKPAKTGTSKGGIEMKESRPKRSAYQQLAQETSFIEGDEMSAFQERLDRLRGEPLTPENQAIFERESARIGPGLQQEFTERMSGGRSATNAAAAEAAEVLSGRRGLARKGYTRVPRGTQPGPGQTIVEPITPYSQITGESGQRAVFVEGRGPGRLAEPVGFGQAPTVQEQPGGLRGLARRGASRLKEAASGFATRRNQSMMSAQASQMEAESLESLLSTERQRGSTNLSRTLIEGGSEGTAGVSAGVSTGRRIAGRLAGQAVGEVAAEGAAVAGETAAVAGEAAAVGAAAAGEGAAIGAEIGVAAAVTGLEAAEVGVTTAAAATSWIPIIGEIMMAVALAVDIGATAYTVAKGVKEGKEAKEREAEAKQEYWFKQSERRKEMREQEQNSYLGGRRSSLGGFSGFGYGDRGERRRSRGLFI
jgi:hypothetical protein